MTGAHFFWEDLRATLLALALFSLFAIPPGYVLSRLSGVLGFRQLTLAWRFIVSIPVSLSAIPMLAFWLDFVSGHAAVWLFLLSLWALFVILIAIDCHRGEIRFSRHWPKGASVCVLLAIAWAVLAFGSLVDIPIGGDRLYTSVTSSDQSYRTAFTDAITRTSIAHPVNPTGFVVGAARLRYHYFWFALCSLIDQAGGGLVPARHAFFAGTIWCGIALACVIAAYLRFFTNLEQSPSSAWILKSILLLGVTGLDIIPTISLIHFGHILYQDMEDWNEAVTSWVGTLLWAPHATAALVAGLIAFLILFHAPRLRGIREQCLSAALAGILLGTMLGESIYVGFVIAIFLSLWTMITYFAGWRNHTVVLLVAGLVTVALALPYLLSLTGPGSGGTFLQTTVRDFRGARAFGWTADFTNPVKTYLARLAFLPLNYFLELGLFLVAGILYLIQLWRARPVKPDQLAAVTLLLTSVGICTFLKSGVITNNDLGWRGFLPAQFILLLWAAEVLLFRPTGSSSKLTRPDGFFGVFLRVLLVIGVISTIYSTALLRTAEIVNDHGSEHAIGKRNLSARQVYERLRDLLPESSVVQQNPTLENPVYWGLYANRQTAAIGPHCGTEFGGAMAGCDQLYRQLVDIFDGKSRDEQIDAICRRLRIDVLVVTSGDPVWHMPDSWIWVRSPLISTPQARAFLINSARIQAQPVSE